MHALIPEKPYASYANYLAALGSSAVDKARGLEPSAIIGALKRSGLRGRGGAGFPTGLKWQSIATHPCKTRYAVCNAAEGEPGTFKDRWLIRHNPYAVVEGLLIAAHVVDARKAYLCLKASFTVELERLRAALAEMANEADLPVEIVEGPEEYLYGEEKALLNVIEGLGPLPREAHYPPYEVGLFAKPNSPNPALVNNAETLARVSTIVRHGEQSFRAIGSDDTPGLVLFTLSGDVAKPGVYELPSGLTMRALLDQHAGGSKSKKPWKAVLSGVSTGALGADKLDVACDFGSLALAGSGLGSGGFIAYDDDAWMPRVAQTVARFLYVESCNQCSACKTGLRIAWSHIDELFDARTATPDDTDRALEGARHAPQGNRCYLPVQGSILIPSLIKKFRGEFEAQLANPTRATREVVIPKIVDFDGRDFVYDTKQRLKRPDWTYVEEVPVTVQLPAELVAAVEARGLTVEDVLRKFVQSPR